MKRFISFLTLSVVCCLGALAECYTPETVPNPRQYDATAYVANPDGVLDAHDAEELQRIAQKIDSISQVELCIVALRDIGNADAFEFALNLANLWGVGKRDKDTGVLMLLAVDSRDVQIVTGDGVQGVLTDGECGRILDGMLDFLRAEQYGAGLLVGAKSIGYSVTTNDALLELLLDRTYEEPSEAPWNVLSWLTSLFGVGYVGSYLARRKCRKCGKRTLKKISDTVVCPATRKSSGYGVRFFRCTSCNDQFSERYTIPRLPDDSNLTGGGGIFVGGMGGHSSGGSFGGGSFGGGHFSGGGAGRHF